MLKLTLFKSNQEKELEEKIYTVPFASGFHYRKLMEFDETIDYTNLDVDQLDILVGFVCDVFGNQFTINDFYEGIPSHQVFETCSDVFAFVRTGKTPEQLKKEIDIEDDMGKS